MSNNGKVILGVVAAIVVIGGIWWWVAAKNESGEYSYGNTPAAETNANTTTGTNTTGTNGNTSANSSDDSDQAIQQDMTSANAQMNGLNSDSASADQGLNDQPVQQQSF